VCLEVEKHAEGAVCSIDYSKAELMAIRTVPGKPEERQKLEPGPHGFGVCTWSTGDKYVSDVPNLTIASRASHTPVPLLKKPAAGKAKAKAKPKAKAAAASSSEDDEEEDSEEEEEEAPVEAGVAAAAPKDKDKKKQEPTYVLSYFL